MEKGTEGTGNGGGPSGTVMTAAEIFAVPAEKVKEFMAIMVRYRELVEHRDGLEQLHQGCLA